MQLREFQLERYFAQYEFEAPYLMCCSDCQSTNIKELLDMEKGSEKDFLDLSLGYTESKGNPNLRKQIAQLYKNISLEEVLVHAGAEEAIFNFMNIALKPGDHVIVQYPCYQSLIEVAQAIGCEVSVWNLQQGQEGWELDLNFLKKVVKENTKAIIINSPHNPTGYLITEDELKEILNIAREKNIIIFADEVYKYLEYDKNDCLPWVCDLYENAVSLGVMSKSFGLPGLRIGWIATKNKNLYQKMASFKDYTSICNSAPSEYLTTIALKNKEKILARNRKIINNNLVTADEFFTKYKNMFLWNRPKAGPIAFPKLKMDIDVEKFAADLVNDKGVLIIPGVYYDFPGNYFRIGYGRTNFVQCLEKFEEYINIAGD